MNRSNSYGWRNNFKHLILALKKSQKITTRGAPFDPGGANTHLLGGDRFPELTFRSGCLKLQKN